MSLAIALCIISVGIVGNVACALLGCYLVLKRMSLLGDALSHGVLPGIALGVILSGSVTGWGIMVGALAFGVLTAFLAQAVHSQANVPEDSSIGIVFTSLFALGVILISSHLSRAHVDTNCVFLGSLEEVALDTETWFDLEVPSVLPTMLVALGLTLGFIVVFWKELKIAAFDPALATAMGYRANLVHYLLMGMVSLVTVTSFRSIGSIVVVAMLIVPAACAHLLCDRLWAMLIWSALVAVLSSALGYLLVPKGGNVPGMMAVLAGAQLLLAVLFSPRHGVIARMIRTLRLSLRIAMEDILADLYRSEESKREPITRTFNVSTGDRQAWLTWLAFRLLRQKGYLEPELNGHAHLTAPGRKLARSLVRAHRLWEAFLEKNLDLPPDHLHDPATRMEHFIGPGLQEELAAELDEPRTDPHGRAIPPGS